MSETKLKLAIPARILDEDLRVAAQRSRQLDVQGIEFAAYSPSHRLPDLSATGRREFRHLLAAQQRELAAVHVDCGPKGLGPGADVDRVLNGVDRALEAARALGASVLTLEVGPLPEPARPTQPKPKVTQEMAGLIILPTFAPKEDGPAQPAQEPDPGQTAQVDDALRELGRRADRYGVPVAFHSDLSSHAAIERALHTAGCPWFGLDLDPAATLRDDWEMDEILSRLGTMVRHVRARDAIKGTHRRTRPAVIGQGNVNWPEILTLLDDAGYHGWLTIDPIDLPDRFTAAAAGIDHLRKIHQT